MQIINQRTCVAPIDSLQPHPRNANRGDLGAIHASLDAHGFYGTIVAQESSGRVLAGNHRWQAMKQAGATEIPVTFVDVDDETALRILLVDNKTTRDGISDSNALAELLQELAATPSGLSGSGYDGDALDELLADLGQMQPELRGDPDAVPEVPQEPVSQPGDLWLLGEHRMLVGDALDPASVDQLLEGERVALIVTSPPYNQEIDSFSPSGMHREHGWVRKVARLAYQDSMPEEAYQRWQRDFLDLWYARLRDTGSLFYNHKNRYRDKQVISPLQWLPGPFRLRQEIIWSRPGSVTQNARMFIPSDERIYWLYAGDDFYFDDATAVKSWSTVWELSPETNSTHACPFPSEIPRRIIAACSSLGETVADPFGGSGTTLVACELTGRRARLMDVDPATCDVAVRRWEQLTGKQAVREPATGTEASDHARVCAGA